MPVRRMCALTAATLLLLGCGGGDGGAVAREKATSVPTGTSESTATPTPVAPEANVAARRGLRLARVASFNQPLYVTAPRTDRRRIFVVEQGGRIMIVRGGKKLSQPFLDISAKTNGGGEQGLLSMAFAPDYAESGLFYVDYTDTDGNSRIVEYKRASADRADAGSARLVLSQEQPEPNHNGGQLQFGPDGLLYIGFGDGGGAGDQHGSRGNAQNLGTWLGKILRIDPRRAGDKPYSVPSSNPFVKRSGARPEIYSWGLRNPWRFSFDRRNGNLTIGDVGQNAVEEIDFVRKGRGKGANFGWRVFEGRSRYSPGEKAPGAIKPVIVRTHAAGNCSITGGVVVRDRRLADLYGRYVFGDLCRGVIESARLRPGRASAQKQTRLKVSNLSSFGEDARGRVYAVSLDGPVYRISPPPMTELADLDIARVLAPNPGPYTLDGTNTWIVGRDPAWVIDPGPELDAHLDAVASEVAARGGAGGIAITHDHADHVEGVLALRERLGYPPVAASRHPADVALADGDAFGPLTAVAVPGHADDHLAYVTDGACFTGDAVLGHGSVFVTSRLGAYLSALERLREMGLSVLCPGHGPPVWDPEAKLAEYLDHRQEREDKLLAALDQGLRERDELLDAAWADAPPALRPAAAQTLAAHLDKLREEGRLPA